MDEYWFWLCNLPNIWNGKIRKLLNVFRTPKAVYEASAKQLEMIEGLSAEDILVISDKNSGEKLKEKVAYLKKKEIYFISRESSLYPEGFRKISDAPYGFYVKGNLDLLKQTEQLPVIAMVGTRNASLQGNSLARRFGYELGRTGAIIVSGMARGIDAKSHIGTLEAGGKTIAVLGCGVDICYPKENIELYMQIAKTGLLLSEYPCGMQPAAWQFPQRNRLISALADRVLVIEAKKKSGSLITVDCALEQGKDVFAIPGKPGDLLSEGCNQLIKQGAALVTKAEEMLVEQIPGKCKLPLEVMKKKKKILLEKELEMVYSSVDLMPKDVNTILEESGIGADRLPGLLVQLQMMDLIEEPLKNYYQRSMKEEG